MTPQDIEFINQCVDRCQKDPLLFGTPILPKRGCHTHHGVLVWDPIKSFSIEIECNIHHEKLTATGLYVNGSRKDEVPRTLYDFSRVIFLCSAKYKCSRCKKPYLAHNQHLLNQIGPRFDVPFIVFHKNAVTQAALAFVCSSVTLGN